MTSSCRHLAPHMQLRQPAARRQLPQPHKPTAIDGGAAACLRQSRRRSQHEGRCRLLAPPPCSRVGKGERRAGGWGWVRGRGQCKCESNACRVATSAPVPPGCANSLPPSPPHLQPPCPPPPPLLLPPLNNTAAATGRSAGCCGIKHMDLHPAAVRHGILKYHGHPPQHYPAVTGGFGGDVEAPPRRVASFVAIRCQLPLRNGKPAGGPHSLARPLCSPAWC